MLCADANDLTYSGHLSGANTQYLLVDLIICDGEDTCQDVNVTYNQIAGTFIDYLYIDTRYDYGNLTNPIRYTINYNNQILIDQFYYSEHYHTLHANVAYNDDNTTTTFYSVEYEKSTLKYLISPFMFTVYFSMSQEYDVYVPYVDYQPVVGSSRRDLASNSDENIMSPHYFIFYLIAQIGGFLAFFILLIGAKVRSMNENYLMYQTINEYHEISNHENRQQEEQDNLENQFSYEQSLNFDRSRSANQILPNNRNSVVHEDDPLMYQNEGGSSDEQDEAQYQQHPEFDGNLRI